jgi:protein involved in polysaccharide export with SLBB domain
MNPLLKRARRFNLWWTAGVMALALVGCASHSSTPAGFTSSSATTTGGETRLRVGDQLQVRLETVSTQLAQQIDTTIDENGEISLPLVGRIKAEGLTPSELAERIQANYVPRFYIRCNATVLTAIRFFYVGGEVRAPGRYNWSEDVTLLKAINTAGGFTDYANRRRVEVSRGKEKKTFNAEELRQHPEKDFAIRPGDSIYIPRSIF